MRYFLYSFLFVCLKTAYSIPVTSAPAPMATATPTPMPSTTTQFVVPTTHQEEETEEEQPTTEPTVPTTTTTTTTTQRPSTTPLDTTTSVYPTTTYQVSSESEPTTHQTTTSQQPTTTDSPKLLCPESPPNELLYRCTDLQWRLDCLPPRQVCYGKFIFGHCYGVEATLPARWVCAGSKVNGNCVQANDYWTSVGRCDLVRVRGQVGRPCDIFDLVDKVGENTGCFSDNRHVWSSTECGGQHNLRGQWTYNQDRDTYACASKFDDTINGKCCLVFGLEDW